MKKSDIEAIVNPMVEQYSEDYKVAMEKWNPPENRPFPLPSAARAEEPPVANK
jgi:hypothetical protein